MEVECKDVVGFEKYYQVSRDGRIFSKGRIFVRKNGWVMTCRPMELVQKDNGRGYMTVMLYDENKGRRFYVHRLVAKAFVDNPNNLPQVNHKDENKYNNLPHNLEWCTAMYNMHYGEASKIRWEMARKSLSKPVIQYKDGKEIARYPSSRAAAKALGVSPSSISAALTGKNHSCAGFQWKFQGIVLHHIEGGMT